MIIVITASIVLGYHNTEYKFTFQGKSYIFLLGYVSIINTGLSMIGMIMFTKTYRQSNPMMDTPSIMLSSAW